MPQQIGVYPAQSTASGPSIRMLQNADPTSVDIEAAPVGAHESFGKILHMHKLVINPATRVKHGQNTDPCRFLFHVFQRGQDFEKRDDRLHVSPEMVEGPFGPGGGDQGCTIKIPVTFYK